ncbi:hypothetical protein [Neisseria sp. Ec49-e6-T10]|uniref:hypothetical protein n=1 Tax=Neisseria sp. Ec49-e6-T10 TaxID=3140744 RepID=UPI003EC114D5
MKLSINKNIIISLTLLTSCSVFAEVEHNSSLGDSSKTMNQAMIKESSNVINKVVKEMHSLGQESIKGCSVNTAKKNPMLIASLQESKQAHLVPRKAKKTCASSNKQ